MLKSLQAIHSFLRPSPDQATYDAIQRYLSVPGRRLIVGNIDTMAFDIAVDRSQPVQTTPVPGAHGVEVAYTPCTLGKLIEHDPSTSFWLKTTLVDGMVTTVHLSQVTPRFDLPEEIERSTEPHPKG